MIYKWIYTFFGKIKPDIIKVIYKLLASVLDDTNNKNGRLI